MTTALIEPDPDHQVIVHTSEGVPEGVIQARNVTFWPDRGDASDCTIRTNDPRAFAVVPSLHVLHVVTGDGRVWAGRVREVCARPSTGTYVICARKELAE